MQQIIFSNSCPIPNWIPENKQGFRKNINNYIEKIIQSVDHFKDEKVHVTYFQRGVGSIVAKVKVSSKFYVIKTTESSNRTTSEIKAYEAMRRNNIKVPEIYIEGIIDGYPFFIMEYFPEENLSEKLESKELTLKEVANIKGETFVSLKKIHSKGYGWPIKYDGKFIIGNLPNLDDLINEWFFTERAIEIAKKYEPTTNWNNEIIRYTEIVKNQFTEYPSHLGSFDFQTAHFFASTPPTFFDPDARIEPENFDLAFLLMPSVNLNEDDVKINKIIVKKIENNFGTIDQNKFSTALWLQTFRKATSLLLKPTEERITRGKYMLKMLTNRKGLDDYLQQYFN